MVDFPTRRTENARRADQELIRVLDSMIDGDERISSRSVARRMQGIRQTSSLTRDLWRVCRIQEAEQARQQRTASRRALQDGATPATDSMLLGSIEIAVLARFACAARFGNLARAAESLHMDPSTLSRQVQRLEMTLGTPLLIRHGNGVVPTEAGSQLSERLNATLPRLLAPLQTQPSRSAAPGSLVLGLPPELAVLLGPHVLKVFRQKHPDTKLRLHEACDAALLRAVAGASVDLALVRDAAAASGLVGSTLLREELGLVVHPRSPLADTNAPISLRAVADVPLVLPSGPHDAIRHRIDETCHRHGITLRSVMNVDSVPMMKALVRHDFGNTILPAMAIADDLRRGLFAFRPITRPALTSAWMIVRPEMADSTGSAAPFVTTITLCATDLVAGGAWPQARMAAQREPTPHTGGGQRPAAARAMERLAIG